MPSVAVAVAVGEESLAFFVRAMLVWSFGEFGATVTQWHTGRTHVHVRYHMYGGRRTDTARRTFPRTETFHV